MTRALLLRPLEDVLFLDPVHAAALRAAGIPNVATMFERGPRRLHRLVPDVAPAGIGDWYCLALLQRVPALDATLASVLLASGIRTLTALAASTPAALQTLVESAAAGGAIPHLLSAEDLNDLQQDATRLAALGMVAGRVLTRAGVPLVDATARIGGESTTTNADGWFAFNRVPPGSARLTIELPAGTDRVTGRPLEVAAGRFARLVLARVPATPRPLVVHRRDEANGDLVVSRTGMTRRLVERPLADFPEDTPFLVREVEGGHARLLSLYRAQAGRTLLIERTTVDTTALPSGAAVDSIVRLQGNALVLTPQNRTDFERVRLDGWWTAHPPTRRRRISIR